MTPGKLVVLLVGIGLMIYSLRNAWRNYQAQRWPTATGLVTRSELHPDGDAIDLLYEYEVRGRRYESQRLCYLMRAELAASAAKRFPVGAQPDVRFDPLDPSRAALMVVPPRDGIAALGFPVIFLASVSLFW